MFKNPIEILLGIVFLVVAAAGFVGIQKTATSYFELQKKVEALEQRPVHDKRFDDIIMKDNTGKEFTRIQVYDFVTGTVINSLKQGQK